jgi:two-component system nitrogen regulation response regulator GlnG
MKRGSRVLVVDADPALAGLLEEWLSREGCTVVPERPDLVVVDLPFPRERGAELIERMARAHPGAPIIALSSNFFAGVEASGALARTLGVACVLAKPLTREALVNALRQAA